MKKIKNTKKRIFIVFLVLMLILPVLNSQEDPFGQQVNVDEDKVNNFLRSSTIENFNVLSTDEKNKAFESLSKGRKDIFLKTLIKEKIKEQINNDVTAPFAEKSINFEKLNVEGLISNDLSWTNEDTLSNGKTSINLENLPPKLSKLSYNEETKELKYQLEKGESISLKSGSIGVNANAETKKTEITYVNEELNEKLNTEPKIKLNLEEGEENSISVDENSRFKIAGDSSVEVDERKFKALNSEKESSFEITAGSQFNGKNLELETNAANVKIDTEKNTEIILNRNNPQSDQFVQMVNSDDGFKDIKLSGENIEVNLKDEPKPGEIQGIVLGQGSDTGESSSDKIRVSALGKNLKIKNGGDELVIDGDKTYNRRILGQAIKDAEVVNENNPNLKIDTNEGGNIAQKRDITYVHIGEYNGVLTNPKSAKTGLADPEIENRDTSKPVEPLGLFGGEVKLFEDAIEIDEEQLGGFFEEANNKGIKTSKDLGDFFIDYSNKNIKMVKTFKYNIPKENIEKDLNKFVKDLRLPSGDVSASVYNFKSRFLKDIGEEIPIGTQMILISNKEGKPLAGVVKTVINGKTQEIKIPGSYVRDYLNKITVDPLSRKELFERYQNSK